MLTEETGLGILREAEGRVFISAPYSSSPVYYTHKVKVAEAKILQINPRLRVSYAHGKFNGRSEPLIMLSCLMDIMDCDALIQVFPTDESPGMRMEEEFVRIINRDKNMPVHQMFWLTQE